MATTNLGRVAIVAKGEYSPTTQYEKLDIVRYEEVSYLVLRDVKGVEPTDGEDYSLLAGRGESAYEVAVDNGYVGTEQDWLAYIRADGSISALQKFMTNDASTEVSVPAYGNIPSLQGYISTMFENGGLPATPFKTKALMTASSLANDKYAMVTDGGADNGLYVKTAGTWVKSSYDPLTQAKSYTDTNKADTLLRVQNVFATKALMTASPLPDGSNAFVGSDTTADNNGFYKKTAGVWGKADYNPEPKKIKRYDIFEQGYVDSGGNDIPSNTVLRSPVIKLKAGTVLKFVRVGNYQFGYQVAASPLVGTPLWRAETSLEYTVTAEKPYVRFFIRNSNTTSNIDASEAYSVTITTSYAAIYEDSLTAINDVNDKLASKVDSISYIDYTNALEMGYVDSNGDAIASTDYAMTPVYKLPPNSIIELKKSGRYVLGFSSSATDKVKHTAGQWFAEDEKIVTITADKPYFRIFLRGISSETLSTAKILVSARNINQVVYKNELSQNIANVNADLDKLPMTFSSSFRSPSLAVGGVFSLIDDDGRIEVLNELYPQMKAAGVPFGIAVVPDYLSTNGYMTENDIKTLSDDSEFIEILSHSFTHINMATGGTEHEREQNAIKAKKWFFRQGLTVHGFALPYGADSEEAIRIVQRHYVTCYDYGGEGVETFSSIRNHLISRASFLLSENNVERLKSKIDQAVANNGWFKLCTHTGHPSYWSAIESASQLQEIIDYARSKGMKFMKPNDAFQVFGNIVENDSGFKIQANGKIVGAS